MDSEKILNQPETLTSYSRSKMGPAASCKINDDAYKLYDLSSLD